MRCAPAHGRRWSRSRHSFVPPRTLDCVYLLLMPCQMPPKQGDGETRLSADLLGRAHQQLVDGDMAGPGYDVGDVVGDVLGGEPLETLEALLDGAEHLRPVVPGELGRGGARLDQG